ncbi:hypothetical protein ACLMJK_008923 [Lecanora helva]
MSSNGDNGVLADVTNKVSDSDIKMENQQRVRDASWVEPQKFDYNTYNAGPKEQRSTVAAVGTEEAAGTEEDSVPTWAANATKYEWEDDYGEIGPKYDILERQLFGNSTQTEKGSHFSTLTEISVTFESETMIKPISRFEDAGLHPAMLENVKLCRYDVPTPIQAYVLPSVFKNIDIIGVAQTGSGKTAAFLIPTLSKLMGKAKKLAAPRPFLGRGRTWTRNDAVRGEPLVLVVTPTRELAIQIFTEACRLCYRTMLRPCVAYGGAPASDQMDEIQKGCDILIATPGRLQDFMQRPNLLSMNRVRFTIIDEADEMVSPDWIDDMRGILGGDNNDDSDHVYMMFSATFPKAARAMAKEYMSKDHIRIRVGRAGSTHLNIIFVSEAAKRQCLFDLLLSMPPARTIVFVNNKKAADFLDDYLFNNGLPSTSIHSDRTQREREDALRAFKTGKAPILVATGVSARGLDIKNVMHVINFDLPNTTYGGIDEYVHRIGRTARIGNTGVATSFYNERNEDIAESLTKLLLETRQEVPEFLENYKPAEGEQLQFDDDTDEEGEEAGAGGGWGGGGETNGADAAMGDAWDGGAATSADDDAWH